MNFWSLCRYWLSNIWQVLTKTARALQHQVFFQHRPFARLNINSVPNLWWNLSIFPARMLKFYIMCLSYFKLNQKRILPISKYFASFLWSKKAFQLDCLAGASCVERLTKFLFAKFFSSSVQQRFWGGFVSLFGFCGLWGGCGSRNGHFCHMMAASWKVVDLHCGIVDTLRSYPEKNFNNFSRGNFNSDGRNHLDPGWINGHSGKSIRVSASSNATWMDRFFWKIKPGKAKEIGEKPRPW